MLGVSENGNARHGRTLQCRVEAIAIEATVTVKRARKLASMSETLKLTPVCVLMSESISPKKDQHNILYQSIN